MRVSECLSLLLGLLIFLNLGITACYAGPTPALLVERKEDEILLPPYLRDLDGGILNVVSERTTDESHTRSAKPGEWLEYGDEFSLPDRMAIYVWMNEGQQWVGGGVFEGKIVGGEWNTSKPSSEITLNRGWMKVWAKPSSFSGTLLIKTPKATLAANDGVFWVLASATKTEVYVLSGTVKDGDHVNTEGKFYEFSGNPGALQKTSEKWDFVSLENRIAGLYSNLVKLSHRANDEWLSDTSSKKYADLRSKGWKKADRYFPSPAPKK